MNLSELLNSKPFSITVEVIPPKGNDLSIFLGDLERVKGRVDAILVRELPSAVMRLGALSTGVFLKERGFAPIVEFTCRDRNRLALQADLLGASVLGIENILVTLGEDIKSGDHPEARAVFDLNDNELLGTIEKMRQGSDLAGNSLQGSPSLAAGASVVVDEREIERAIAEVEKKVSLGARFIMTSPIFKPALLNRFMGGVKKCTLPILTSVLLLKSAGMANYLNKNIPGISIPEEMIKKLLKSSDRGRTSVELASELIAELKGLCQGINVVPIGWESKVPALLDLLKM